MIAKIAIKRHVGLFPLCCLLCFCLFGACVFPAEIGGKDKGNEVLSIGTGAIVDGNLASAKESAISQALIRGVENYLVSQLGSHDVVNNFERLIQEIMPGAEEGVEKFHILSEGQVGYEYKVFVRVRINEKVMDEKFRKAGLVFTVGPPIRVLLLISETRRGKHFYWWKEPEARSALSLTELFLHNILRERGFSLINRMLSVPEVEYSDDLRSLDLQDADVLRWGRLFSGDVVIYGQTVIADETKISLTLKVFDVNRGIQICQDTQIIPMEKGPEGEDSLTATLRSLVSQLTARMTPAIVRAITSDHKKIQQLEITLKGLSTYKQFKVFKDFLRRDVKGVESVRQTRAKKDSISIAVEFQGDRSRFLDRVLNHEDLPLLLSLDKAEKGKILLEVKNEGRAKSP